MAGSRLSYYPLLLNGITLPAFLLAMLTLHGQLTYSPARGIPVLCYHKIRNYTASDGEAARTYTVTPQHFAEQMKMLADSGYHPVLPQQLYLWYTRGLALPDKPVMITFDDNTSSQYLSALPILNTYGFKAVFFIMTISLNKPDFLSAEQLKTLVKQGHEIGCHSLDHKNMREYTETDWRLQIDQPLKKLASFTGKPIRYFAYPFGVYTEKGLEELQQRGIQMAFMLEGRRNEAKPLLTIKRILVAGSYSATTLNKKMMKYFEP